MVVVREEVRSLLSVEIRNMSVEGQLKAAEELAAIALEIMNEESREGRECLPRDELIAKVSAAACVTPLDANYGVCLGELNGDFVFSDGEPCLMLPK